MVAAMMAKPRSSSPAACGRNELATTPDAVALAAALSQAWAGIVLFGAATGAQLTSALPAPALTLGADQPARLAALTETDRPVPQHRSHLAWT
jgi:aryl-alcohol dehydrogenase-like predicted oxidoreductase